MWKLWICTGMLAFSLFGCSTKEEAKLSPPKVKEVKTTVITTVSSEKPVQLEEPSTLMQEWMSLSPEQKQNLIEQSVEWVKQEQANENSPVKAVATTEQFVQAIDDRYQEIQDSDDSAEKFRLNNTTVAMQVSILGKYFEADF